MHDQNGRRELPVFAGGPVGGIVGVFLGWVLCEILLGFAIVIPVVILDVSWIAFGGSRAGLAIPRVLGSVAGAYFAYLIGRFLARNRYLSWTIVVVPVLVAFIFAMVLVRDPSWSRLGTSVLTPFIIGFLTFAAAFLSEWRRKPAPAFVEQALQPDASRSVH